MNQTMTAFVLSPARETDTVAIDICPPGEHEFWEISAERECGPIHLGRRECDELGQVLADLIEAFPEVEGRVIARWPGEDGAMQETKPGTVSDCMDQLMEYVCDETPDDAPNTDDHPLEELRTALLDAQDILDGKALSPSI